jgi:hypothetical protein
VAIITVLTGALERNTPRTCTPENADVAITGDNQDVSTIYVADLAIDPVTGQADFSNSVPILPQLEDNPQLRESMQQLLDIILGFFEEETRKVDNGELKEENMLLESHDLQTDDTNTKHPIRQLPASFDRRRA